MDTVFKDLGMLVDSQEQLCKINSMTYCDSLELLSVGLSNGMVVSYSFDIESYIYQGEDLSAEGAVRTGGQKKRLSKQQSRQLLQNAGNELSSTDYVQSEEGTPELDVEQGRFSEPREERKGREPDGGGMKLKKFKLLSHSCNNIHSCVKSMVVDQHRHLLYSAGKDRVIHCQ